MKWSEIYDQFFDAGKQYEQARGKCIAALCYRPELIKQTPEGLIDHSMLLEVARRRGDILKYLEPNQMTVSICLAAVQNNSEIIEYIPEEMRTRKILAIAGVSDSDEITLADRGFDDIQFGKAIYRRN